MNTLEILFWKFARHIIKKGYSADCENFEPMCASCKAGKTIEWINEHISLLEWSKRN